MNYESNPEFWAAKRIEVEAAVNVASARKELARIIFRGEVEVQANNMVPAPESQELTK